MMKIKLKDGTGDFRLKYLVEDVDRHGNVRIYVRRKGQPKIRLHEAPGTQGFLDEYRRAIAGETKATVDQSPKPSPASKGSLRWLVEQYYGGAEFKRLKRGNVRRAILDAICSEHGHKPYALMEKRHVRKIRDEKFDLPEAANARVKALRQVFKWAQDVLNVEKNPAEDVPYLKSGSGGFHTWTIDEVSRFVERHPRGTKARKALAILLFTGVRRSDAVRLGPQMESRDRKWLNFTEVKGASRKPKQRELPILPELRVELDASPSGHLAYLVTEFGRPFTANGFGNWFRRRCNEAGLPHCSAHGLRKAGAAIAAQNGASSHALMAIFGWETLKQAELYTKEVERKKLIASAMHLLVPEQMWDKSVPLSDPISKSGTFSGNKA
jgi:integrase